jgi:hypothetical protein
LRAKEIAKALPRRIVTDKAGQAPRGIERAFINDPKKPRPKHNMIVSGASYPNGNRGVNVSIIRSASARRLREDGKS